MLIGRANLLLLGAIRTATFPCTRSPARPRPMQGQQAAATADGSASRPHRTAPLSSRLLACPSNILADESSREGGMAAMCGQTPDPFWTGMSGRMSETERDDTTMKKYLLAAVAALAICSAHASDVYNDNGDYIGKTDGCSAGECEVIDENGNHIGNASGCLRADECDVTNDDGDHIGTAEANDDD